MVNFLRRLARSGAVFLLSAAACLASGSAHATCQPPALWSPTTTYNFGDVVAFDVVSNGALISGAFYQSQVNNNMGNVPSASPSQWNSNNILVCQVTVQPIDVCSSTGTTCPVINSMGQTAASNPGTSLIGFIDPLTKVSAEQQAFAQIGVGLAFSSVVLYKSPANPNTTNKFTEPGFGWLHVCSCDTGSSTSCPSLNSCSSGQSSIDLLTLTQQPKIANSAQTPYTPIAPLNSNQTIPNLAFVHVVHPVTAGTIIKGFSWDFNNGGAIASDSVFAAPGSPQTIAHELGHMMGGEHNTFGAGPLMCPLPYGAPGSYCPENLMTAGSATRQVPNGLIDSASNNCGATPGQACWVPQIAPENTMEPVALGLLTTGGVGQGQCTTATFSQCQSQQAAFLLSNFMYTIPNTVSMVSQSGSGGAVAQAATKSSNTTPAAQSSAAAASNPIIFNVSGVSGADTLLAYIVIIPQPVPGQFTFSSNPFKIIKESRTNLLQDFDEQPLDIDVPYPSCAGTSALCGEVEFNRNKGQGFGPNDFMQFSLNIQNAGAPATLADLCGAKVAFIYSSGYTPVSVLGCSSSSSPSLLTATSLSQDPTTPPQVIKVSTAVTTTTTPGCLPVCNGQCCNPTTQGVNDTNLVNGAEIVTGQTCFFHGSPVPCQ